jgi:hypothetical protein
MNKILFALYIKENVLNVNNKIMVEIGCVRSESEQNSTLHLATFCNENKIHFITVDVDPDNINLAKHFLTLINPAFESVVSRGEDFLQTFNHKIDFLYLDGFDFYHPYHSQERKEKYNKYLNLEITNENCWNMHLECVKVCKMAENGIICINNVYDGYNAKGKLAIPYLLDNNYHLNSLQHECAILSKHNNSKHSITKVQCLTKYTIILLGYKEIWNGGGRHTNWYPWNRFQEVFETLNYEIRWFSLHEFLKWNDKSTRRIFICWNDPTSIELIKTGYVTKYDIILQKLTSLGKGMENINWGDDPKNYFKDWKWPLYKTVEYLFDLGLNIYGFGCKTITEPFHEKHRICDKLKERIFWITWGSTVYNQQEIKNCEPIIDYFKYDIGYIGSKWGQIGRGNIDQWNNFIEPLLQNNVVSLWGSGLQGQISDEQTKVILKESKLCPIIHAPSWVAERGIQDRFYTVFTSGRFGVVDNEGVYDLFDTDEVVCEVDPNKYVEKSLYYMNNPKEQFPYIEKVQKKIKKKYNFYDMWKNIIERIKEKEYNIDDSDFTTILKEVDNIKNSFVN